MYVIDYKHVLCLSETGYQLLLKLFHGRDSLTEKEEQLADETYDVIVSSKMTIDGNKRCVGLGEIEYQVVLKLLQGDGLTRSEEQRTEQMYRTAIAMKKAKETRRTDQRNAYVRPTRSIRPTRHRDPSESDVMKAIIN